MFANIESRQIDSIELEKLNKVYNKLGANKSVIKVKIDFASN